MRSRLMSLMLWHERNMSRPRNTNCVHETLCIHCHDLLQSVTLTDQLICQELIQNAEGISSSQPIGGNQSTWLIDSTHPIIFENPPLPQRDPRTRSNNQPTNILSNESTQNNVQSTDNNSTDNQQSNHQDNVVPGPSNNNISDTVNNTITHMDTTTNNNPPVVTPLSLKHNQYNYISYNNNKYSDKYSISIII